MSNKYKVIFSRYAESDLIEIIEYYQSENPEYAKKILVAIEEKVGRLNIFPERGRIVPELEKQNISEYREIIEGNYRIIYSIQERIVAIHTIIDGRRNMDELLINKLLRFYT